MTQPGEQPAVSDGPLEGGPATVDPTAVGGAVGGGPTTAAAPDRPAAPQRPAAPHRTTSHEHLLRPLEPVVVGPRTKGLRLRGETAADGLLLGTRTIDDGPFACPLLTLDDRAMEHNIEQMAWAVANAGASAGAPGSVEHAPHVKTHMSAQLFARQLAAGAWGATVANTSQARVALDWGTRRVFLANELLDPDEVLYLRNELEWNHEIELWLYVDSVEGVTVLSRAFSGASPEVLARLGVLVELGVQGGRTGVRSRMDAVGLARAVRGAGLTLLGVAGYEGSVAGDTSPESRDAVAEYLGRLRATGQRLVEQGLVEADELVLSAGGSSFLDVVLAVLPGEFPEGEPGGGQAPRVVVRSGAYIIHDDGFYARMDPWPRIPGAEPLHAAATVWGSVLSVPEPGMVIVGVGRRDVSYDIDLPIVKWRRPRADDGTLGQPVEVTGATVTALNDQHLYLTIDPDQEVRGPSTGRIKPGDVVGLGISHPCTLLDKWRVGVVCDGERPVELVAFDF